MDTQALAVWQDRHRDRVLVSAGGAVAAHLRRIASRGTHREHGLGRPAKVHSAGCLAPDHVACKSCEHDGGGPGKVGAGPDSLVAVEQDFSRLASLLEVDASSLVVVGVLATLPSQALAETGVAGQTGVVGRPTGPGNVAGIRTVGCPVQVGCAMPSHICHAIDFAVAQGARIVQLGNVLEDTSRLPANFCEVVGRTIRDYQEILFIMAPARARLARIGCAQQTWQSQHPWLALTNVMVGSSALMHPGGLSPAATAGATCRLSELMARCLLLSPHLRATDLQRLARDTSPGRASATTQPANPSSGLAMQLAALLALCNRGMPSSDAADLLGLGEAVRNHLLPLLARY